MKKHLGWVGVDFDGCLATYHKGLCPDLGEPIWPMIDRVKRWLAEGYEVRVVTARASHPMFDGLQKQEMELWLLTHLGMALKIQCHKDYEMIELWDDRVVQVESNTGKVLGRSRCGLDKG